MATLDSVFAQWCRNAERIPHQDAVVHWRAGEKPRRWTWECLLQAVPARARRLRDLGVRAGDVCALIMRHHPDFYPLYLAVSAVGALPAVLAYPNSRLHPDKFRAGLVGMARGSGLDWLLTERDLEGVLRPLASGSHSTVRGIAFPLEWTGEDKSADLPDPPGGDVPCLLQHSSGTTGLQKAVMLSHGAVLGHVRRYAEAIAMSDADRIVSWLPLYHDMGLIAAFHLPLALGIPVVQLDPFEWVAAPVLLFEALAREGGTVSWLPNFAFNLLAARVHEEDMDGIDLGTVRLLINCSEPVRADSMDWLLDRFGRHGLRASALGACYAMAETTFAVTQTAPGRPPRRVPRPDSPGMAVSSGSPISGCAVRVVDDGGRDLPERWVGEILIRSASLFDGYRNQPGRTAEAWRDGWYRSGDLGFLDGGECFVVGRSKDVIVVAGRNLHPEDVEDAVGRVEGVLPGRVVAFGVEDAASGTERVHVVAETALTGRDERRRLRRAVIQAAMDADVTVAQVHLAPPRWLVKSSAGKLARSENRARTLRELATDDEQREAP